MKSLSGWMEKKKKILGLTKLLGLNDSVKSALINTNNKNVSSKYIQYKERVYPLYFYKHICYKI